MNEIAENYENNWIAQVEAIENLEDYLLELKLGSFAPAVSMALFATVKECLFKAASTNSKKIQ